MPNSYASAGQLDDGRSDQVCVPWQRHGSEPLLVGGGIFQITPRSKLRAVGVLDKLRHSCIGRFYLNHLRHYRFVRFCTIWLWQRGFSLYVSILLFVKLRTKAGAWLSLVDVFDYAERPEAGIPHILADSTMVATPSPIAFPERDQAILISPHESYVFPEIIVTTVRHATVSGGTNLVVCDGEVIHHNLYDFDRDYTSEELHGRYGIAPRQKRICLLSHDDPEPEVVERAAVFVDACAYNYAHWLTEVLPRIAIFCREGCYKNVPLIINDGLHCNLLESLRLITMGRRPIIMLPIDRSIIVSELLLTSVVGYVPFERRNAHLSGHSHGMFSPVAFAEMRRCLFEAAQVVPSPGWPNKIYLRRNSGLRKVVNSAEIEHTLVAQGYTVIEPEKLSFIVQVQLFSQAEAVVASTGAAVANIVFCPPGIRITILIARFPDTSYWYWQNIALASGNAVRYVLGEVVGGIGAGIHSDFRIEVKDLLNSLADQE